MSDTRIVVITGGTQGIGLATAKRFLQNGDIVAVGSVDGEEVVGAARRELSAYGEVDWQYLDVSSRANCKAYLADVAARYGRIDVLANVAGIVENISPILEIDFGAVEKVLNVNLMGTLYMALEAANYMARQGKGTIINTSSVCAYRAGNSNVGYHAAKGGVVSATKVLGRELSRYGIRCVAVAPGFVRTRMFDPSTEDTTRLHMMKGRMIEPAEIAGAIFLMASEDASAINGSTVMADDGLCSFYGPAWTFSDLGMREDE